MKLQSTHVVSFALALKPPVGGEKRRESCGWAPGWGKEELQFEWSRPV